MSLRVALRPCGSSSRMAETALTVPHSTVILLAGHLAQAVVGAPVVYCHNKAPLYFVAVADGFNCPSWPR